MDRTSNQRLGAMTEYTWVITRDVTPFESSNLVMKKGPTGETNRASAAHVIQNGAHFRLLDEFGAPMVFGYIHGEYLGHEPLVDYGRQLGCVDIEYQRNGNWLPLDAVLIQRGAQGELKRNSYS